MLSPSPLVFGTYPLTFMPWLHLPLPSLLQQFLSVSGATALYSQSATVSVTSAKGVSAFSLFDRDQPQWFGLVVGLVLFWFLITCVPLQFYTRINAL